MSAESESFWPWFWASVISAELSDQAERSDKQEAPTQACGGLARELTVSVLTWAFYGAVLTLTWVAFWAVVQLLLD